MTSSPFIFLIDAYRADAEINGLKFDSHTEEKAVELFSSNIIRAGEDFYLNPMDAPFIPTWSRVKSAIPDFLIRLEKAVNEDNCICGAEQWKCPSPNKCPYSDIVMYCQHSKRFG